MTKIMADNSVRDRNVLGVNVSLRKFQLTLGLAAAALAFAAGSATAQEKRLEVRVNMPRIDCPTCAPILFSISDETLPPGAIRFKAMLLTRTASGDWDEGIDVTHEANWELNGGEAVMIEPGVSLSLRPDESVRWYVTHPATDSADFARVRPLLLRPATPEDDLTPYYWPRIFPQEPAGSQDARLGVGLNLGRIQDQSGVPTTGLRRAAEGVSFGNNANYSRRAYMGLGDEVVKLLGPDESAVTLFPTGVNSGISHNGFEIDSKGRPFIALTQPHFANIVADNLIDANGMPNATMRLIIHELIHVIIDAKTIKFEAKDLNGDGRIDKYEKGEAIEEQVAHAFETNFLRWNEQIKDILKNAEGRALTEQEIARIAGILRAMRAEMLRLRLLAPGSFDALLIELMWTDANNNGIFDFLEGWLTERQLNIEELLKPLPTPRGGEPEKVTPPAID